MVDWWIWHQRDAFGVGVIPDVDEDEIIEDVQVATEGQSDAACRLVDGSNGKDSRRLCRRIDR